MESIKFLARHLIHTYKDIDLYEKLTSMEADDRKSIIRLINWSIKHGERDHTGFTQQHLNEIADLLIHGNDEQVAEFYFDLTMYVLSFGRERIEAQLKKLDKRE